MCSDIGGCWSVILKEVFSFKYNRTKILRGIKLLYKARVRDSGIFPVLPQMTLCGGITYR